MKNLWTIASYPTAAVAGYFIAFFTEDAAASILGLEQWMNTVIVLAISGLLVGFLVDEVIPTYIHEKRGRGAGSAGGDDFGGGGDLDGGDFDFE
ncbi:MAG: hypothetical protein R6V35_04255 [Candidatus Nanohaloarchaea archaeon]